MDVRVGTLDFPGLMEPDVHAFVESKVDWVGLPEEARTVPGKFQHRELWPKGSLRRLDRCLERVAEAKLKANAQRAAKKATEETAADGEKTPTAVEFGEVEGEDDEAFEKRYRETERALQERLERLRRKLEDEDGGNGVGRKEESELEKLTGKLEIGDAKSEESTLADLGRGSVSNMARPS